MGKPRLYVLYMANTFSGKVGNRILSSGLTSESPCRACENSGSMQLPSPGSWSESHSGDKRRALWELLT